MTITHTQINKPLLISMGTSGHIIMKVSPNKTIYSYCHFDAYRSYLGLHLIQDLILLLTIHTIGELRIIIDALHVAKCDDVRPTQEQIASCASYTNLDVSQQSTRDWYCLLYKCQGSLVKIIDSGIFLDLQAGNSEFDYVIDFETKKFSCKEANWDADLNVASLTALKESYLKEKEVSRLLRQANELHSIES
jgi:hypothetical protein